MSYLELTLESYLLDMIAILSRWVFICLKVEVARRKRQKINTPNLQYGCRIIEVKITSFRSSFFIRGPKPVKIKPVKLFWKILFKFKI